MSSSGSCNIPLITLRPRLLLNWLSSSITCTNPLFRPNSTWKYGKFFGIEPRNPFSLVSISFFALCWLHSSSASSIACDKHLLESYKDHIYIPTIATQQTKSEPFDFDKDQVYMSRTEEAAASISATGVTKMSIHKLKRT